MGSFHTVIVFQKAQKLQHCSVTSATTEFLSAVFTHQTYLIPILLHSLNAYVIDTVMFFFFMIFSQLLLIMSSFLSITSSLFIVLFKNLISKVLIVCIMIDGIFQINWVCYVKLLQHSYVVESVSCYDVFNISKTKNIFSEVKHINLLILFTRCRLQSK